MRQKQRRPESRDKGGANAAKAEAPMERFKSLTRALLTISNTELKEEQRRYDEARSRGIDGRKKDQDKTSGN
jgi:hypothetical protein